MLFGALVLLSFVPFLERTSGNAMPRDSCIFCDIANGRDPKTEIVAQTNEFVIFKDIKPASTYHYLAVPRRHIESLKNLKASDDGMIVRMEAGLKEYFRTRNIDTEDALLGFHMPPFISVKHLHLHAISPRSNMSFVNRLVFRTGSSWFKTVPEAREYIKDKV